MSSGFFPPALTFNFHTQCGFKEFSAKVKENSKNKKKKITVLHRLKATTGIFHLSSSSLNSAFLS